MKAVYVQGIDGLRAISIGLVLLAHWEPSSFLGSLMEWGRGGLMVFFTISGFLITRILLSLRDSGGWFAALKKFYARRALRIFPLYYLALTFVLVIDLTTATGQDALWHALFLNNLSAVYLRDSIGAYGSTSPWWSLAVEEQFYLLWAPLVLLAPRRWVIPLIAFFAVLSISYRWSGWAAGTPLSILFIHTMGNLDALAAGAAVAVLSRSRFANSPLLITGMRLLALLSAAALLLLCGLNITMGKAAFVSSFANIVLSGAAWYGLAASLIYLFTTDGAKPVARALEHPAVTFIGRRSYGIYLLHQIVAHFMYLRIGPRLESLIGYKLQLYGTLEFLVYSGITVAIAAISYKYFESPILRRRSIKIVADTAGALVKID
jgi:peptidoglycan/LPS O-acetylase OafA/YrhL